MRRGIPGGGEERGWEDSRNPKPTVALQRHLAYRTQGNHYVDAKCCEATLWQCSLGGRAVVGGCSLRHATRLATCRTSRQQLKRLHRTTPQKQRPMLRQKVPCDDR